MCIADMIFLCKVDHMALVRCFQFFIHILPNIKFISILTGVETFLKIYMTNDIMYSNKCFMTILIWSYTLILFYFFSFLGDGGSHFKLPNSLKKLDDFV